MKTAGITLIAFVLFSCSGGNNREYKMKTENPEFLHP
jgi:hypothetical protein